MHENTLPGTTAGAIKKIGESGTLAKAYLAGGTAVALQLGHRISRDLDFFTPVPFDEQEVYAILKDIGLQKHWLRWRTIGGTYDGVDFSYFYYNYPLLFPTIPFWGIMLADLRDLAAMKIDAIATRGTERDFIDLYFILLEKQCTLLEAFAWYSKKYDATEDMILHATKSLTYFEEAEAEQARPLEMLRTMDWGIVKKFFRDAAAKEIKIILGG